MPASPDDVPVGTGLILEALAFAARKHRDQRRLDVAASPYINHPIALAGVLWHEGQVRDPLVIAAAILHDTIEDTDTTWDELRGRFGEEIADIVLEVTDVKWLDWKVRKRLQVVKAERSSQRAKLIKLADKICNLRDMLAARPANWSLERTQRYFDWAKEVIDGVRGVNPELERKFDEVAARRPG